LQDLAAQNLETKFLRQLNNSPKVGAPPFCVRGFGSRELDPTASKDVERLGFHGSPRHNRKPDFGP
jgi:hypothetical protein